MGGRESELVSREEYDRFARGFKAEIKAKILSRIEDLRRLREPQMGDVDPVHIARKVDEYYQFSRGDASEQGRKNWMAENTSGDAERMLINLGVIQRHTDDSLRRVDEVLPQMPEDTIGVPCKNIALT